MLTAIDQKEPFARCILRAQEKDPKHISENLASPRELSFQNAEEGCRLAILLVADAFQISLPNMVAGTRGPLESAHARQAAMYLAHVALGISLTAIGRFFGRDHSTIAHGCRRVEDRRDDSGFDVLIAELALAARIAMHLDREITA